MRVSSSVFERGKSWQSKAVNITNTIVESASVILFMLSLSMSIVLPFLAVYHLLEGKYDPAIIHMLMGLAFYWIVRDAYQNTMKRGM